MAKRTDILIGLQWGDEGKGKVVDVLSSHYDIVVRYQGGANAGHTVKIDGEETILHLIPAGILHEGVVCVIGNGVAFDPDVFFSEVEYLEQKGIDTNNRIFISDRSHLVLPYHIAIDKAREKFLSKSIGTTARGIGPLYTDKYRRNGIRVIDIYSSDFESKIEKEIDFHNKILKNIYDSKPLDKKEIMSFIFEIKNRLKKYVKDTVQYLQEASSADKYILLEGAQGVMLDIDFGTYPFVTSSSPTTGGALSGSGLPWHTINEVIGITKSYTTRVGGGPFPSRMPKEEENIIRQRGGEYGATTGRPRNCGYLDLVALKYAVQITGTTLLVITKMDILSGMEKIPVVTEYDIQGNRTKSFPSDTDILNKIKIITTDLKGWQEDISKIRNAYELPKEAQEYISFIENYVGVKVAYISVSPERDGFIEI